MQVGERRAPCLPQSLDAPFPPPTKQMETLTIGIRHHQLVCGNCLMFTPHFCPHTSLAREEDNTACCEIHRYFCDFGFVEPPGRTSWLKE